MDNEYILGPNGELYHWGIKGMKWGQRRYQNKDGSLTPEGRKRYADELAKVEAETKKLKAEQRNKARTAVKMNKLDEAKKELAALKSKAKSKKGNEPESEPETDAQKRERILKNPTAKDVVANSHLFSDTELRSLKERFGYEKDIKNMVPAEISRGKEFADKFCENADNISSMIDKGSTLYNNVARIYNSLYGTKNDARIPYIEKADTNTKAPKSEADKIKEKADLIKAKNTLWEAENTAEAHAKTDAKKKAAAKAEKQKADAEKAAEKEAKAAEKAEKSAEKAATQERESSNRTAKNTHYDNTVYEGEVVGSSQSKSSSGSKKSSSSSKTVIDAEYWSNVSDTSVTSMTKNNNYSSSGSSFVSGYLNTPVSNLPSRTIAGLLSSPKDDD